MIIKKMNTSASYYYLIRRRKNDGWEYEITTEQPQTIYDEETIFTQRMISADEAYVGRYENLTQAESAIENDCGEPLQNNNNRYYFTIEHFNRGLECIVITGG